MGVASTAFHLFGALRRAIGRVFLWFFVFVLVGVVAVELAAFQITNHEKPTLFTHIVAAIIGLLAGYAAALTVIVREAIRFLITTIQTVEKDVKGEIGQGEQILARVASEVSGRNKKS